MVTPAVLERRAIWLLVLVMRRRVVRGDHAARVLDASISNNPDERDVGAPESGSLGDVAIRYDPEAVPVPNVKVPSHSTLMPPGTLNPSNWRDEFVIDTPLMSRMMDE